jgi:hypothetical protein
MCVAVKLAVRHDQELLDLMNQFGLYEIRFHTVCLNFAHFKNAPTLFVRIVRFWLEAEIQNKTLAAPKSWNQPVAACIAAAVAAMPFRAAWTIP